MENKNNWSFDPRLKEDNREVIEVKITSGTVLSIIESTLRHAMESTVGLEKILREFDNKSLNDLTEKQRLAESMGLFIDIIDDKLHLASRCFMSLENLPLGDEEKLFDVLMRQNTALNSMYLKLVTTYFTIIKAIEDELDSILSTKDLTDFVNTIKSR